MAYLSGMIYIVAAFLLFLAGKLAYDFHRRGFNLNAELLERNNLALAIALSGYFLGLTLAVGGALAGTASTLAKGLLSTLGYGLIAIVLLNVSIRLNEWLIFTNFRLEKEIIADRNCGVGLVVAANHVAVGLILYGVISGEGGGLAALLVFWALGQATLILAAKVYDLITPFHLSEVIEQGNVAVGAALAGVLLALGNIIRFAVQGSFVSWSRSLTSFAAVALLGLILLPLVRLAIDKLITTPGHSLTREEMGQQVPNIGAGVLEGSLYWCISFLIGWCF
ncbi:MAG: DUF350 domain-containing protein [Deltaproteobacteria bacterium]|nr:DUF350 domain-containing protein [Deltaproteobacteria bacterium]